uniref:Uncharacterized protein n=1 Tax=Romanomermis culicivorax TaxID=13658 RepID=A0A915IWW0_ROMCU
MKSPKPSPAPKKYSAIQNPIPNPMSVQNLAENEDEDDLTMAGDDELHDYSEEEINGLWREKAVKLNEQRTKAKERAYFLQVISWKKNRIIWEAFDSPFGHSFYRVDEPHIRVEEISLPSVTLDRQWILNENWEWIATPLDALDKLKRENNVLKLGGIVGVYQPSKSSPAKK